ncbi:MAG: hypothetical protein QOI34_1864, partial [Verrucomicrobiota bacterium]
RDYEKEVNTLIADQRSIILCTYPLTATPGDQVFDVAHVHEVAVARRNGIWEIIETPELKQTKTAIKKLNEELEQKVEERTRELTATNEALRSEITERKLAQEAIKQTEDRIQLVIDTIPTMAWSLRPDGVLDFLNQRWLDYTGLSLEEAIEEPTCTVHTEDLSRALKKWVVVQNTSEAYEDEMRLRRADGEYRWFLIRIAPLLDEQGNIIKRYGVAIDIEDRKRGEMQSRALIDAIPHQIWSGPADGTVDYCNDRWRTYVGLEQEDFRGDGWQSMIHPDDRDRVVKAWQESVTNGRPYEQEERHRGADGTYRWFLSLGVPLRDPQGRIVRWYGTNTDIEDRKRAEDALNAHALRYKTLLATSTDSIYVVDEKGNLQEANAAFLQRRGYTAAEVKALNVADWDVQWSREQLQERMRKLVGSSAVFETRHRGKDGSVFDVEVSATSVRIDGEQLFFCVTRDITERKQAEQALRESEERFRQLTENINDIFWLSDVQHKKALYVSPAYERIWGRTLASLYASPRSWTEALHPEDRERILALRADGGPQATPEMTYRIVRPDGSLRWIYQREFLVKDADGKAVRVAGVVEDITERKRVELALDERLRFETLLTELSAAFANLPTATVDQEIDKWLRNLVEFLDVDRATFDQVGEGGTALSRTHSHTAPGIDPLPLNATKDRTPWVTEQILRGNTVKWSRVPNDIPEQASKEKEFAGRFGAKSVVAIPVCIGGSVICAISFTSMRIYREWPDEMVARLRLVGEIFANAIARKRAGEILFRREAELNEAQRLASIGSWEWDILADAVTCSDEVGRIYGIEGPNRNSPDRPFSEFVYPDDRARRSAAVEAALNGGPPYNVEFRIVRPDKSARFVHSRGRLIYDETGKPIRMIGMTQDITDRKRAAKDLEEANHQLRFLSRRLFEVQEEERRHLARELHDEIGQALTAAKINLQSITANGDPGAFARVQETTAILDRLLGQVRQISLDLRPSMLDDLGLVPALRSLLDQQGRRASIAARFSAEMLPENLDPETQTTCFRIAQEAITNAVRHANAT